MKSRFVLVLCFLLIASGMKAQDVHFSQFWASPMSLNPALTGLNQCSFRAAVNYRNQWGSVVGPSSYQTYGASFDAALLAGKLRGSKMGAGVQFFNDKSGDGVLKNITAMGSFAYHQNLANERHFISIGGQVGMVQKSVDPTKFVFEDMIDNNGVIPGATSSDILSTNSFTYLDLNVGFHWSSTFTDNFQMYAGASYFHLTEPNESFFNNSSNILEARYLIHGGFKIGIKDKWVLLPSFLYQQQTQGSNEETLYGMSIGHWLGEGSYLYFGGYHRLYDAVVIATGVDFNNIALGLSYDININDLSTVSGNKGGLELALTYFGCISSNYKPKYVIDCPRF